jgi:hypothetical protein
MNRSQQAYYLENGKFSDSLRKLELGFQPTSEQFVYSVRATTDAAFQYGTTRPDCRLCRVSLCMTSYRSSKRVVTVAPV